MSPLYLSSDAPVEASDPIRDGCEPPCGCWELNSGSLEEQSVLLTAEPSLQSPNSCIFKSFVFITLFHVSLNGVCMSTGVQIYTPMHAHGGWGRKGHQESCSIKLHLSPLRQGPSLNLEPG